MRDFVVFKASIKLSDFGSATRKSLTLMTNREWMVPTPATNSTYALQPVGYKTLCSRPCGGNCTGRPPMLD